MRKQWKTMIKIIGLALFFAVFYYFTTQKVVNAQTQRVDCQDCEIEYTYEYFVSIKSLARPVKILLPEGIGYLIISGDMAQDETDVEFIPRNIAKQTHKTGDPTPLCSGRLTLKEMQMCMIHPETRHLVGKVYWAFGINGSKILTIYVEGKR